MFMLISIINDVDLNIMNWLAIKGENCYFS